MTFLLLKATDQKATVTVYNYSDGAIVRRRMDVSFTSFAFFPLLPLYFVLLKVLLYLVLKFICYVCRVTLLDRLRLRSGKSFIVI